MSAHFSFGSHSWSALAVSSGFLVSFGTHLSLLDIRCTWVSTEMPMFLSQHYYSSRWAILSPTPGNFKTMSSSDGTWPSNSLSIIEAACFKYLAFLLWNPTLLISWFSFYSSISFIIFILKPFYLNILTASAVTSSFV